MSTGKNTTADRAEKAKMCTRLLTAEHLESRRWQSAAPGASRSASFEALSVDNEEWIGYYGARRIEMSGPWEK